ncbi:hypothetical protein Ddye_006503 [Dipteronia dyeriana]|uniref:RNase H type-1 domain-containing protein n=1 Tax=Dipteronia dyeriana TaxID=168575 RepID=A0AAD9XI76_9ROSI|nr:hypothetical protein Ddye_006503 [Dipteronia dyeriana]
MALCLAGKVLTPGLINREAFRTLIARIGRLWEVWRLKPLRKIHMRSISKCWRIVGRSKVGPKRLSNLVEGVRRYKQRSMVMGREVDLPAMVTVTNGMGQTVLWRLGRQERLVGYKNSGDKLGNDLDFLNKVEKNKRADFSVGPTACNFETERRTGGPLCYDLEAWFWRNRVVHCPNTFRNEDVFGWATAFLKDYQEAKFATKVALAPSNSGEVICWSSPLEGNYKINNDAVIQGDRNQVGIGIVVRDSYGYVMGASTQKIAVQFSPPITEATSILRGLRFAVKSGFSTTVLESDAQ